MPLLKSCFSKFLLHMLILPDVFFVKKKIGDTLNIYLNGFLEKFLCNLFPLSQRERIEREREKKVNEEAEEMTLCVCLFQFLKEGKREKSRRIRKKIIHNSQVSCV